MELCQVCGDIGYNDLLQTCSICHEVHEHLYCMEVMLSMVPATWQCKACQSHIDKVQQSKEHKFLVHHPHLDIKTVLPPERKVASHKFKGPKTGKVKFLPTEDVLGMTTRGRPASSMHSSPSPRPNDVDVSYNPLSRRNPAVGMIASLGSANQTGLAQESPRNSKLPAFAKLQTGLHKIDSQSKSIPDQTPSLVFKNFGTRKMADRSEALGKLLDISNKNVSASSSENFLKIKKEEDKPGDRRGVNNNNNNNDSIGATQSLGKRKNRPEDQMRICDVTNKVNSTSASQRLEKRQMEEDKPACIGVSSVLNEEKSIGALEDLGVRRVEDSGPEDFLKNAGQIHEVKSTGKKDISIQSRVPKKSGILSNTHGTSESNVESEFQDELLNPPATMASWNGSFAVADIFNKNGVKDSYDGLRAHTPRKVSRKAYEFAKKLPKMVKLKVYHRCDMWPQLFNKDGPSEYDIALYFLPGDLSRSSDYYLLLELIEKQDLMMQSCMDGVELLIYTSKQLPLNSQTFNAQSYFWGVFRSMKRSAVTDKSNKCEIFGSLVKSKTRQGQTDISSMPENDAVQLVKSETHQAQTDIISTLKNDAVQDMEIDMIGGVDVGRVDIPLKKQKDERMEIRLEQQVENFTFSNSLILKRKSAKNQGREISGYNAKTSDCNNPAAAASSHASFKLHGHKMIDRSAIQDRSKDFRRLNASHQSAVVKKEHVDSSPRHSQIIKNVVPMEELLVNSSSSSFPEFPPGFTKPVKQEVPPSCSNEPLKIGSPSADRVNSRRFSESPRMFKYHNH